MKKVILFLVLFFFIFTCSKDEDKKEEPCYLYSTFISDSCDCVALDFNCGNLYFISEDEHIRISNILESSSEQCNYINGKQSIPEENFEGYAINITKGSCPDFGF